MGKPKRYRGNPSYHDRPRKEQEMVAFNSRNWWVFKPKCSALNLGYSKCGVHHQVPLGSHSVIVDAAQIGICCRIYDTSKGKTSEHLTIFEHKTRKQGHAINQEHLRLGELSRNTKDLTQEDWMSNKHAISVQ